MSLSRDQQPEHSSVVLSAPNWTRVINALRRSSDTYDLAEAIEYELIEYELRRNTAERQQTEET